MRNDAGTPRPSRPPRHAPASSAAAALPTENGVASPGRRVGASRSVRFRHGNAGTPWPGFPPESGRSPGSGAGRFEALRRHRRVMRKGSCTVTSPLLPELEAEGDPVRDALDNARDAFAAVIDPHEDMGPPLPEGTLLSSPDPLLPRGGRAGAARYREAAGKPMALGRREQQRGGGGRHRKWLSPKSNRGSAIPDWGSRDGAAAI